MGPGDEEYEEVAPVATIAAPPPISTTKIYAHIVFFQKKKFNNA